MNLKQMEMFRMLMLTGSASETARRLHRTQPAVSLSLSSLEADLGLKLFERQKGKLTPTPEANYLYREVEEVLSRLQGVLSTVKDIQNKQYGYLRIGSMPGPSIRFLPDLMSDFLEQHPKIQASLQTRTSDAVKEWVASGQYDLGLAESWAVDDTVASESFDLRCLCAIPTSHQLASKTSINPKDLDGEPLVTLYADHALFHNLRQIFEKQDAKMNIRIQTRFFIPALRFVERGLGICIMDPISILSYTSQNPPGKVVFKKFTPQLSLKVALIKSLKTPNSIIAEQFLQLIREKLYYLSSEQKNITTWS